MKKHHDASETAHKSAIDKFSPEAKEADAKLTKIATDKGLVILEIFQWLKRLCLFRVPRRRENRFRR